MLTKRLIAMSLSLIELNLHVIFASPIHLQASIRLDRQCHLVMHYIMQKIYSHCHDNDLTMHHLKSIALSLFDDVDEYLQSLFLLHREH